MTVFDRIPNHLDLHQQSVLVASTTSSLPSVWKCGPTWSFVFDVLHQATGNFWQDTMKQLRTFGETNTWRGGPLPYTTPTGYQWSSAVKNGRESNISTPGWLKTEYITKMKWVNLPLEQTGMLPFHCPYSLQISVPCPSILYPSSQEKL